MFGGPPPPPSAEELKQAEDAANQTVFAAVSTCFVLYISPFVVDYVRKLV